MNDRLAVVTGGTRGIGAAVCERLVASGYRTVALARAVPERQTDSVEAVACDVTDPAAVDAFFQSVGPVDVLVNNAGVSSSSPLQRTTLEDWDRNHAVNATAPFLCTRAVLASMRERGSGHIVTVASTASLVGDRYTAAYSASKHAVVGLMRVAASELEGSGVVVAWVCPTFVRTDMTVETIANIAARTDCDLQTAERKLAEATPHGRILEVHEVADAVLDLVHHGANGTEVLLDGRPPT